MLEGVTSGNHGAQSVWAANLRAGFPDGVPYQTVFSELASQGYVSNTYSGTVTLSNTPEPGTMMFLMTGIGLIGLGKFRRRL